MSFFTRKFPFIKEGVESFINGHPDLISRLLYRLGKDKAPMLPDLVVKIETTNACNGSCDYCPRFSMTRPIGVMEEGLYNRIVDECADIGIRNFHLQNYGDPLLDPFIARRISYAKKKGINNVTIYTNGLLLNENLSEELIKAGLDDICVSIDPPDDNTDNQCERKDLPVERVSENIRNFSLIKKRLGKKKPKIIITATASDKENPNILEFKNNWLSYVDKVMISPVHNWGGRNTLDEKKEMKPCLRLWFTLTILWDGRVSLCCVDYDGKHIIGDVRDSTIKSIWNSDQYRALRRQSLTSDYKDGILCKNCSLPNKDSLYWTKNLIFK